MDTPPFPNKKYQVIYADPPWRYDFAETKNRKIENQYPTMAIDDIKALTINDITDKNCVLYLWATAPKLIEALDVIKSWGFEYKTHAIWDKEIIGMGYWFRGQHELLLVATKGKISPPAQNIRKSSILKYRRKRHSNKPTEIRQLISMWFPHMSKIELFARQAFQGWDCWGNEVSNAPTQTLLTQSLDSERLTRGFQATSVAQIPAGTSESPIIVFNNEWGRY